MTLTNEQIEGWLAQTWAPGQYDCDAEATNAHASGWAGRCGSVVLIERSDGIHEVEHYASPEEAAGDWDFYEETFGSPKIYVVTVVQRIVANTPGQADSEAIRRIKDDDDVLYCSNPYEWAPTIEEEPEPGFHTELYHENERLEPEDV